MRAPPHWPRAWPLAAPALAQTPAPAQPAPPGRSSTPGPGPSRQLTVDEAVGLALEQNLSLRVERINPEIQQTNVDQATTAWTPSLTGYVNYNNTDTPPDSFLSGSSDTLKTDLLQGQAGRAAADAVGRDVVRGLGRASQHQQLDLQLVQPDAAVEPVAAVHPAAAAQPRPSTTRASSCSSASATATSPTSTCAGTVVSTVRSVKNAYWNLKAAIANLDVQQQSLDLARQTLKDNRTRVEVGTMAPIDIVEAESEVARNEENVIVAEATIRHGRRRAARADLRPGDAGLLVDGARPDRPAADAAGADRRRRRGAQRARQAHRPAERARRASRTSSRA